LLSDCNAVALQQSTIPLISFGWICAEVYM